MIRSLLLLSLLLLSALAAQADKLPIYLSWQPQDKEPNLATAQLVQGSEDGVNFQTAATLPRSATSYTGSWEEGKMHFWRIVATNDATTPQNMALSASPPICTTLWRGLPVEFNMPAQISGIVTFPTPTLNLATITYQIDGVPVPNPLDTTTLTNGQHVVAAVVTNADGIGTAINATFQVANQVSNDVKSNTVALYKMDEGQGATTVDSSGHNFTANLVGATWAPGQQSGGFGIAMQAAGQKLVTPIVSNSPVRTFMMWIKLTGPGGNFGRLFDKHDNGEESEILFRRGTNIRYWRRRSGLAGAWSFPAPPLNVWTHIAVVYDGRLLTNVPRIYVNGNLQQLFDQDMPTGVLINTNEPYIFGNRGDGGSWVGGVIDKVQIEDSALTQEMIKAAM